MTMYLSRHTITQRNTKIGFIQEIGLYITKATDSEKITGTILGVELLALSNLILVVRNFYAEILTGHRFSKTVPIYSSGADRYIESLGYNTVRDSPNPSWRNSIRKISDEAFIEILKLANIDPDIDESTSHLESGINALDILRDLNTRYADIQSEKRAKKIKNLLDRGSSVTKALKSLLGAKCQICGWEGFEKKSGEDFIEAHHIVQLSERKKGSLCTENIILICPNCHREVHYGKDFSVSDDNEYINVCLSKNTARIRKNTIDYLLRSDNYYQD